MSNPPSSPHPPPPKKAKNDHVAGVQTRSSTRGRGRATRGRGHATLSDRKKAIILTILESDDEPAAGPGSDSSDEDPRDPTWKPRKGGQGQDEDVDMVPDEDADAEMEDVVFIEPAETPKTKKKATRGTKKGKRSDVTRTAAVDQEVVAGASVSDTVSKKRKKPRSDYPPKVTAGDTPASNVVLSMEVGVKLIGEHFHRKKEYDAHSAKVEDDRRHQIIGSIKETLELSLQRENAGYARAQMELEAAKAQMALLSAQQLQAQFANFGGGGLLGFGGGGVGRGTGTSMVSGNGMGSAGVGVGGVSGGEVGIGSSMGWNGIGHR